MARSDVPFLVWNLLILPPLLQSEMCFRNKISWARPTEEGTKPLGLNLINPSRIMGLKVKS